MKRKSTNAKTIFKGSFSSFFLLTLFFLTINILAQNNQANENEIPIPSSEIFKEISGLIASGRFMGTRPNGGSVASNHPETEIGSIYNKDGVLWYQFSIYPNSPLYYPQNTKEGFSPFNIFKRALFDEFFFRLVAESPNWYEVEINEKTQKTKYIARNDHFFAKTTYEYWVRPGSRTVPGSYIRVDNKSVPLLNGINGEKIDDYIEGKNNTYHVVEIKGDWIQVRQNDGNKSETERIRGWVRWRDGRKILVGCYFNNWKIPENK